YCQVGESRVMMRIRMGEARPKGILVVYDSILSSLNKRGLHSPAPVFSVKTDTQILCFAQSNRSAQFLRVGMLK
ncbi:MAG: hypothetical protein PVJ60_00300, partial [Phycisphaerales bacterium]